MKKLFFILFLAFLCAIPAHATTVTISASQLTTLPFNPTNIGSARTYTVSATNGSATVTSSAAFPTNIVGIAGFQVVFSGDSTQYVVSAIASTSSLTLTTSFGGSTGSKTMTVYPYVLLRTYATAGFQDNVTGQNIQPGAPGSGQFYKQVAVSIINSGSGNVAWIPEFTLASTTNALINNQARYVMGFYRPDGSLLSYYVCGSVQQLALPATTPTTWTAICNYNSPGGVVPPANEAYTKSQIDQRLPSCNANQIIYAAATGNIYSCLSAGTNITISGGTISASGGGGSLPTATYVSTNYSALTSDWLVAMDASGATRTVTLYAASGNTSRIVSVCKNDTSGNLVLISDGVTTLGTIYSPTACLQFSSDGSAWKTLSY